MIIMYCHRDVLDRIVNSLRVSGVAVDRPYPGYAAIAGAIEIHTSRSLPKHPTRWEFPRERCVEYEASDEAWCRYFGIGHEVEDTSRIVLWRVNTDYLEPRFPLRSSAVTTPFWLASVFSPRVPWCAS